MNDIDIKKLTGFIREELIYFVERYITPLLKPERDALKTAADFLLKKSTKTMKSVCELSSKHYGEDAQILGRTIFENALNLTFIFMPNSDKMREELAKLYILHGDMEQLWKSEELEKLKDQGKCVDLIESLEKGQVQLEQNEFNVKEEYCKIKETVNQYLIKEKDTKPNKRKYLWSSLSLRAMAETVGEPYECDYNLVYWSLSNLAHPSTLGSYSYYGISHESDEYGEADRALSVSFDYYWRIVDIVNQIYGLGFENEIDQVRREYLTLQSN